MLVRKELDIILASKSPRRRELLSQIDIDYRCIPSDKEEIITESEPDKAVTLLSGQKACDIEEQLICKKSSETKQNEETKQNTGENTNGVDRKDTIIIGADTVVAFDGRILGKPEDEEDAYHMLRMLSGKCHQVYTGVTVLYLCGNSRKELSFAECTSVYVRELSGQDITEYIKSGEPMDKAGAYGIQGKFAKFVEKIDGDYNNVVGLPISRLFHEVREKFGVDLTNRTIKPVSEISACIFDLDGTILDTIESIGGTVNLVLEELNLPVHSMNDYKHFAGDGQIELIKRALAASGDEKLIHFDAAMNRYIELFKDRCTYRVEPYEGIRELFKEFKKRKIKICIFSNKQHDNVTGILDMLFGENYFDMVLGQREDHDKKPSGEGIDIILENIKEIPEHCIYVGDTNTDMMTGKNYGLYTIGVSWGFRSKQELIEANADNIVDTPMELIDIIDGN